MNKSALCLFVTSTPSNTQDAGSHIKHISRSWRMPLDTSLQLHRITHQLPRPLLALLHPNFQLPQIPNPKPALKRLWVSSQAGRDSVASKGVEDWEVCFRFGCVDVKGGDEADEGGVKLAICEV